MVRDAVGAARGRLVLVLVFGRGLLRFLGDGRSWRLAAAGTGRVAVVVTAGAGWVGGPGRAAGLAAGDGDRGRGQRGDDPGGCALGHGACDWAGGQGGIGGHGVGTGCAGGGTMCIIYVSYCLCGHRTLSVAVFIPGSVRTGCHWHAGDDWRDVDD